MEIIVVVFLVVDSFFFLSLSLFFFVEIILIISLFFSLSLSFPPFFLSNCRPPLFFLQCPPTIQAATHKTTTTKTTHFQNVGSWKVYVCSVVNKELPSVWYAIFLFSNELFVCLLTVLIAATTITRQVFQTWGTRCVCVDKLGLMCR